MKLLQGGLSLPHRFIETGHVTNMNHTIDWDDVRHPAKEPDWKKKGLKEAIFVRKVGMHTTNWDGRALPYSQGILNAAMLRDLDLWRIHISDEGSS